MTGWLGRGLPFRRSLQSLSRLWKTDGPLVSSAQHSPAMGPGASKRTASALDSEGRLLAATIALGPNMADRRQIEAVCRW